MTDRFSDAALIRICLEGSEAELTEPVLDEIRNRLPSSTVLQTAVRESPQARLLEEQIGSSFLAELDSPVSTPAESSGRSGWLVGGIIVAGLTVAIVWFVLQPNGGAHPRDAVPSADRSIDKGEAAAYRPEASSNAASASRNAQEREDELSPAAGAVTPKETGESAIKDDGPPVVAESEPSSTDAATAAKSEASDGLSANTTGSRATQAGSDTQARATTANVAEPQSDGPWSAQLGEELPPKSFQDAVWLTPGMESPDLFPPTEFRQWFHSMRGRPFQVGQEKTDSREFTRFNGIARLAAPWPESAVLRFGIYDVERCAFHVWRGNTGIRLQYYRHRNPHVWGVHAVSRSGDSREVDAIRVGRYLTNDCGRWHRSNFGTLDLRCEDGYLRLVRGNVAILSVPFDGMPEEIVLDGKLKFREFRMFRSEPLPNAIVKRAAPDPGSNVFETERPADFEWSTADIPDGAFVTDSVDGSVQLTATSDSDKRSLAWRSIANAGLTEFLFQINDADPGTGIYFGRTDGSQLFRITSVWDPRARRPGLLFQLAGQHHTEHRFDPDGWPAPWTGTNQWLRVVCGFGVTTLWASPDGVHWGWIGDRPIRFDGGPIGTVGVFAEPGGDRSIKLSLMSARKFPTLSAVADPQTANRVDVEQFGSLAWLDVGAWLHQVMKSQPKDVPFAAWRQACAVETLRAHPRANLGVFLINGLLADEVFSTSGITSEGFDEERIRRAWRLLSEASELIYCQDWTRDRQFQQLYHEVAFREATRIAQQGPDEAGDILAGTVVTDAASALLNSRMWTSSSVLLTAIDAARLELIDLVSRGRHEAVLSLVDQIAHWNHHPHPHRSWWSPVDAAYPTVAWAELQAHEILEGEQQSGRLAIPRRWKTTLTPQRHPLAQPVSKEAYNVMAEFQAAVSGEAWSDACQVISSAGSANLIGLLPDSLDEQLLISFPNAVSLAMLRHSELRQHMNDQFGAIGRLRVRQAIENGDHRQVESATIQFFGTPAAAESDLWLGDRALAAGQFARARSFFQRALDGFRLNSQVENSEIVSASARLKLASTMLGESYDLDVEPDRGLTFGSQNLSGEDFSKLLVEVRPEPAGDADGGASTQQLTRATRPQFQWSRLPSPQVFQLEERSRFDGDVGEHVNRSAPQSVDWVARQLAWDVKGDLAWLCNRFQLTCLDLKSGRKRWSQQLGGEHGSAHHLPMLPMRPLIAGDSVLSRRFTKNGVELISCDRQSGNIRWKLKPESTLVSDPFLIRGRLQVLAADQTYAGPTVVNLVTIHHETGKVVSSVSVLKMFDAWRDNLLACQVAVSEDRLFFSALGVAACCDWQGQTLWVRRRQWIPAKLDSRYRYSRTWSPPALLGDRLIIGQPESPIIECLDATTGRLVWQHVEPELQRTVAQYDDALLIQTRRGLELLDCSTGQSIWKYDSSILLDGIAVGPSPSDDGAGNADSTKGTGRQILLVRSRRHARGRRPEFAPLLVWLDAANGQELAHQQLLNLSHAESRLGPILIGSEKTWLFSGNDRNNGMRTILELVSGRDERLPAEPDQSELASWHPEFLISTYPELQFGHPDLMFLRLHKKVRHALDDLFPGWLLQCPPQPDRGGRIDSHRGQNQVMKLELAPKAVPEDEQPEFAETPLNAARLIRDIRVPATGNGIFRMRAGHDTGNDWQLTIDAAGRQIHSTLVTDETAPDGWLTVQTSLAPWKGQTVRVMLTCSQTAYNQKTAIYLSDLKVPTE